MSLYVSLLLVLETVFMGGGGTGANSEKKVSSSAGLSCDGEEAWPVGNFFSASGGETL